METVTAFSATLLLILGQLTCGLAKGSGYLLPLDMYDCEDKGYMKYEMTLKTNDDGSKAFDMICDIEDTVDETYVASIVVEKDYNGVWRNVYSMEGFMCEIVNQRMTNIWKNLRDQVEPAITTDCVMEPGHYELYGFTVDASEFEVPKMPGKYRATSMAKDAEGVLVACQVIIFELKV